MNQLSDAIKHLDSVDLERYFKKLEITVGENKIQLKDPYSLSSGWLADPTLLPPTQYGCLYNYLIESPGHFTGESMKAYKSLDAYNYFLSGHVKEIRQHNMSESSPCAVVKGLVEKKRRKQRPFVEEPNDAEKMSSLKKLRKVCPNAAACYKEESDTDTASDDETNNDVYPMQPLKMATLVKKPFESIASAVDEVVKLSGATDNQIVNLSTSTRNQRHSPLWHAHRRGRVTASNIHRIVNFGLSTNTTVKLFIDKHQTDISTIPAVKWGLENEEVARSQYCAFMKEKHINFNFEHVGLVLYKKFPFLAASPDGISKCDCHGPAVVEIKCPFKYRNNQLTDQVVLSDKNNFLDCNLCLKEGHKYSTQVQAQMLTCGVNQCDLVVWTPKDMIISQVLKNSTFCSTLIAKVTKFSKVILIPGLLNELQESEAAETVPCLGRDQVFCSCKRPQFGKMISCENLECPIDFYHYECVGLKRKPKGKWFCQECISEKLI